MKDPYILRKAGDFIIAKDWNDMQGIIREALNIHSHNGEADEGVKLKSEAIDSSTALTIKGLDVTGDLKVDGTATAGGALSVHDVLSVGKGIATKGSLTVEKDLTVNGDVQIKGLLSVNGFKTKSLSNIVPIYIRGTGLNNRGKRQLIIGGNKIYDKEARGLTLTIITKQDFTVVSTNDYDTFGKPKDSKNLATALNKINKDQIGILTSFDAWENNVTAELKTAFTRLGLYKALATPKGSRRPYAAIFEASSSVGIGTAKAVEVLYSSDKNEPFAEIRGWLMDGSFMATGTVANALGNNLGSSPALLVNENNDIDIIGRLEVRNTVIRKVAVATGLGPVDGTDNGQIKTRVLKFTKIHKDTAIRILYCDNLRVNGDAVGARWEIRVNGKAPPGGGIYQDNYGSAGNYHRPTTIMGYATGLAAGTHTIGIWVGIVSSWKGKAADAYTGWHNSRWTIEAEEVWI